jgi:hypothetical protein
VHQVSLGLILALITAAPLHAADYVVSKGRLSNSDFYRLVACGAPVGGACQKSLKAWPRHKRQALRIGLVGIDGPAPRYREMVIRDALRHTIKTVNSKPLGVKLVLDDANPDIKVYIDYQKPGLPISVGDPSLDGTINYGAKVRVWYRFRNIKKVTIVLSNGVSNPDMKSVMLEEVVQGFGLLSDISNPAYVGKSIFDQHKNAVTMLEGQDLWAIRKHHGLE